MGGDEYFSTYVLYCQEGILEVEVTVPSRLQFAILQMALRLYNPSHMALWESPNLEIITVNPNDPHIFHQAVKKASL
jgi:hypothetical protein